MGTYLNPGNSGFAAIRNSIYVDKSGMIDLINATIDTTEKLTCVSRPRRFGKSFAAKMLCAYYDRSCDSSALFDDLEISAARNPAASYHKYLNQYDVIYLDMTAVIYNPNAVIEALRNQEFASYWTETSASKSLMEYISLDFDGMSKTIAELLGGIAVPVDTNGFANDLVSFQDRNDVLTLLIHLGYLAFDKGTKTARIPNEEIRLEFAKSVRKVKHDETIRRW